MPLVTASEGGEEQTESISDKLVEMWSCRTRVFPNLLTQSSLESGTSEGDSPVEEGEKGNAGYPEYHSPDREWEPASH